MTSSIVLIAAALFTSVISGAMGLGGGILLISIMGSFFPPAVLVPLHGIVQLGSNGSRVLYNIRHVDLKIVLRFLVGALVGAGIGSQVVVALPEAEYRFALGILILVMAWMPKLKSAVRFRGKYIFLGLGVTFLSLFVGAVGPLLAPFFLQSELSRQQIVATKAAVQAIGHVLKVITFGFLGFQFRDYLPLIGGMLLAVFLGNYIGKLLLGRLSERLFRIIFRGLITVLALRMIVLSVQ